jgi:hypothetical protein
LELQTAIEQYNGTSISVSSSEFDQRENLNLAAGDLMTEGNNRKPVTQTSFLVLLDQPSADREPVP